MNGPDEGATMTMKQIMAQGPTYRNERGGAARTAFNEQQTFARFSQLAWAMEARRLNLRAANRRWRRKAGLSLRGA